MKKKLVWVVLQDGIALGVYELLSEAETFMEKNREEDETGWALSWCEWNPAGSIDLEAA